MLTMTPLVAPSSANISDVVAILELVGDLAKCKKLVKDLKEAQKNYSEAVQEYDVLKFEVDRSVTALEMDKLRLSEEKALANTETLRIAEGMIAFNIKSDSLFKKEKELAEKESQIVKLAKKNEAENAASMKAAIEKEDRANKTKEDSEKVINIYNEKINNLKAVML